MKYKEMKCNILCLGLVVWIKVWPVAVSSDHSYENMGSVKREK